MHGLEQKNENEKRKYQTQNQKVEDFRLKNHVKVICVFHDRHYWTGQMGHVTKIRPSALFPITVSFDQLMPVETVKGDIYYIQNFNFKPDDLVTLKKLRDIEKKIEIEKQLAAVKENFF